MIRQNAILAVLACAEDGHTYSPVQIQKALLILSKEASDIFDAGSNFNFQAYDYGPFDKDVYTELEALSREELVEIGVNPQLTRKTYAVSPEGRRVADDLHGDHSKDQIEFMAKISSFVRRLSFVDLLSAIYEAYPDMRKKVLPVIFVALRMKLDRIAEQVFDRENHIGKYWLTLLDKIKKPALLDKIKKPVEPVPKR